VLREATSQYATKHSQLTVTMRPSTPTSTP
jgi:hypothetical protein